MVRLKERRIFFKLATFSSFNSKMVRLKVLFDYVIHLRIFKFQFQNGAVKRRLLELYGFGIIEFQFQNGAVKRKKSLIMLLPRGVFQFQNGAVKRNRKVGVVTY